MRQEAAAVIAWSAACQMLCLERTVPLWAAGGVPARLVERPEGVLRLAYGAVMSLQALIDLPQAAEGVAAAVHTRAVVSIAAGLLAGCASLYGVEVAAALRCWMTTTELDRRRRNVLGAWGSAFTGLRNQGQTWLEADGLPEPDRRRVLSVVEAHFDHGRWEQRRHQVDLLLARSLADHERAVLVRRLGNETWRAEPEVALGNAAANYAAWRCWQALRVGFVGRLPRWLPGLVHAYGGATPPTVYAQTPLVPPSTWYR